MSEDAHPIFAQAPLRGAVDVSTGTAPTPYHVYDGHGLVIVGFCDAKALDAFFAEQDVYPVLTQEGRGILILFLCDFAKASHGAHKEFHVTTLASAEPKQTVANDPAAALAALATQPDWGVLSLHLCNDTAEVVAYNTEYLGLDAHLCQAEIKVAQTQVEFAFSQPDGSPLTRGSVRLNARSDAGLMMRVLRHLGWGGLFKAMRREPAVAHVINRKSAVVPVNGRARTNTAPDKMIVTAFDPQKDQFEASGGPLATLGFEPKIVEHLWPFRFIYLHPDES